MGHRIGGYLPIIKSTFLNVFRVLMCTLMVFLISYVMYYTLNKIFVEVGQDWSSLVKRCFWSS